MYVMLCLLPRAPITGTQSTVGASLRDVAAAIYGTTTASYIERARRLVRMAGEDGYVIHRVYNDGDRRMQLAATDEQQRLLNEWWDDHQDIITLHDVVLT